jgi:hypothetical protein
MKIATWNLQRPAMTGARVETLLKHIRAIAADVWILTETRDNIDLSADGIIALQRTKSSPCIDRENAAPRFGRASRSSKSS